MGSAGQPADKIFPVPSGYEEGPNHEKNIHGAAEKGFAATDK